MFVVFAPSSSQDRPSVTTNMRDTTKAKDEFIEWLLLKEVDLYCQ